MDEYAHTGYWPRIVAEAIAGQLARANGAEDAPYVSDAETFEGCGFTIDTPGGHMKIMVEDVS